MGYMCHHAIIVTSWQKPAIRAAHLQATALFADIAPVTEVTEETVNGYRSFMVAPDGSKEGWGHSQEGDSARAAFLAWLGRRADVADQYLEWVEVEMPEDRPATISADGGAVPDPAENSASVLAPKGTEGTPATDENPPPKPNKPHSGGGEG